MIDRVKQAFTCPDKAKGRKPIAAADMKPPAGDKIRKARFETIPKDYGQYILTKKENLQYYLFTVPTLYFAGYLFYRHLVFSILLTLLVFPMKKYYAGWLAEKRRKAFMQQFRDLLYSLSASVSAGRQMPEALREAGGNLLLIYGENSLILCELRHMVRAMDNGIADAEESLAELGRRTGLADVQQLAEVYSICRGSGGNMERAINKTAAVLLDRIDMKKKVQVLTSQKRLEACILLALPFAVLLFLNLISPEYLNVLYVTPVGRLLMTGAALTIAAAGKSCLRLTRSPL